MTDFSSFEVKFWFRAVYLAAAPRHFRQPEIEDLRLTAFGHHDVRRFDVAMNDPLRVRGIERIGDLQLGARMPRFPETPGLL